MQIQREIAADSRAEVPIPEGVIRGRACEVHSASRSAVPQGEGGGREEALVLHRRQGGDVHSDLAGGEAEDPQAGHLLAGRTLELIPERSRAQAQEKTMNDFNILR